MTQTPWTANNIPDQIDRVAVITGANSGIGLETVRELCRKGALVVMGCRSPEKAEAAAADIRSTVKGARLELRSLNLADLSSVRAFAADVAEAHPEVHLLVNNAGVMAIPEARTEDGFEMQLGTNHLGHFALTALLMGPLKAGGEARVINVASLAHKYGKMDFEDLNWEQGYSKYGAYCRSKLANLLFTQELQRRLDEAGSGIVAAAAHPGWTATNLQAGFGLISFFNPLMAQEGPMGALPTLRAATDPGVRGFDYYGPSGWQEMKGYPEPAKIAKRARDREAARMLWEKSEELTGALFQI